MVKKHLDTWWDDSWNWSEKGKHWTANNELMKVIGWLPEIWGQMKNIDLDQQVIATIATSRMQKDYAMAKNVSNMVKKQKNHPKYPLYMTIALLNQAQLFEFYKEPEEWWYISEEKKEHNLLRKNIEDHLTLYKEDIKKMPIEDLLGNTLQSLLTSFTMSTTRAIIKQFLHLNSSLNANNRRRLEKSYMEKTIQDYSDDMIDNCFLREIPGYIEGWTSPPQEYPEDNFNRIIAEITISYLSDPLFILEEHNKKARDYVRKYAIIWESLHEVIDKIWNETDIDNDDYQNIFFEDVDAQNKAKELFLHIIYTVDTKEKIKKEMYAGLLNIVKEHSKQDEE